MPGGQWLVLAAIASENRILAAENERDLLPFRSKSTPIFQNEAKLYQIMLKTSQTHTNRSETAGKSTRNFKNLYFH